ncbi:MAG: insulinase family protein [Phycisphaerales bacterium]|nr:MAG: insulinase family protein [Phycisphaerales bacterium]
MAIEFKQHTLSNGLTIVAEIAPEAHTAAMGFFVKTGARDETPDLMGVSHFLEHMMFKGTDNRTAEQVDQEFDAIGADHNAFTSSEITAFWAHSLPESLPKAGEILSDILRPALRQEDFDAEKKVIMEEIAMYQDVPFWILYERALEVYYDQHPLAHRVLGTPETIAPMPRDGMLEYFQRRYSADNTTVALAGKVDFDRMVELVERHCGEWQRTDTKREQPKFTPLPNEFTLEHEAVNRAYLLMVSPAPSLDEEERYAMSMLGQILGDSDGSRLYWALIETGLAEEAQAQYDGRDGLGDLLAFACCDPADLEEVQATIRREMDGLVESLTEDDLQRVRSKVATGTTLQGELPGGRMRRLGQLWTYFGEYRSLEDELAKINAVTLNDLRAVAESYPLTPIVTGRLIPKGG